MDMKYSRMITFLLIMILFSLISEVESALREQLSFWTQTYSEKLELGLPFSPFDSTAETQFLGTLK